ncbi:MAG: T9SS type A sorting domain-containing protein [Candidatus Kapaibacterium sp.]
MKKMLATAMAFVAVASVALAQQADQGQPGEHISIPFPAASTVKAPNVGSGSVQEESGYGWWTNILRRFGPDGDTNRVDITIPIKIQTGPTAATFVEMRGVGQIFAPSVLYSFFSGSVYNENSGIISFNDPALTDQDYINQFKSAHDFTIDSIRLSAFKNPNALVASNSGRIVIYKTTTNFKSSTYKANGIKNLSRTNTLEKSVMYEKEMTPDDLEATIDNGNNTVVPTMLMFDTPLSFADGESAIVMYENLDAPALEQPVPNDGEVQRMIGTLEYRTGGGNTSDTLRNPIEAYKSFGVLLLRSQTGKHDSLVSAAGFLSFGKITAIYDASMNFFGSANLFNGVHYEFGNKIAAQGLGAVSPNPVTKDARVPFALGKMANIKIDLFGMDGQLVRNLAQGSYVPGNYTADLSIAGLNNGAYIIRMVTGDKVYSTQVNVVR